MIGKLLGPFHFSFSLLGTEILSVSLFTEQDQAIGWGGDEYTDGPFEGMNDQDVDSMLDAMLEAREQMEEDDDE